MKVEGIVKEIKPIAPRDTIIVAVLEDKDGHCSEIPFDRRIFLRTMVKEEEDIIDKPIRYADGSKSMIFRDLSIEKEYILRQR